MENSKICCISEGIIKKLEKWDGDLYSPYAYLLSLKCGTEDEVYLSSLASSHALSTLGLAVDFAPQGFEISGICLETTDASSQSVIETLVQKHTRTLPFEHINRHCYFILAFDRSMPEQPQLYKCIDGTLIKVDFVLSDSESLNSWIKFRLQASQSLSFEQSDDKDTFEANLAAAFKQRQFVLQRDTTAFHILDSSVILFSNNGACCNISIDSESSKLFSVIDNSHIERTKKQRKAGNFSQDVIHVGLLCETSGPAAAAHTVPCAPVIHHEHREYEQITVDLPLDVVVYAHSAEPLRVLPSRLLAALHRQLSAMHACMLRHHANSGQVYTPEVFHFKPNGYDHIISTVYPKNVTEDALEDERRQIHTYLQLPSDQPCVRRLNALRWPDQTPEGGYLVNVHEGLAPSKVKEGRTWLVHGDYAYHHYMQDRFNDDKWGCAYRSLQTLVSWFRMQGYTDKPVPTHRQIQQTLVDINDKPAKIVGSKTWIGSTEVGFVLETYLGVTYKIMFVNSGADMASKGRDLALHFETQGTPVMIGGGVLAHTILGVDFNEVSGDLQFLILDPHYTGAEDLKTIQDKGWCGWKGIDFWDQSAHYNMCMPQRPSMI